jgi:hypothetical protein
MHLLMWASVCVCVRTRGCALLPRRALLRGTLGLLRWHLRGISGGAVDGVLVLTGCTREYVGGTPRKCVRACDAVHLWGLV